MVSPVSLQPPTMILQYASSGQEGEERESDSELDKTEAFLIDEEYQGGQIGTKPADVSIQYVVNEDDNKESIYSQRKVQLWSGSALTWVTRAAFGGPAFTSGSTTSTN